MKTSIKIILIIFCAVNAYSQSGWIQQNSGTNVSLNSVRFINSQTGVCIGNTGKILRTTNSGANWIQQSISYQNNLHSLAITSSNVCFAVGDSGLTLKSTNAGISWIRLNLIKPSYYFNQVSFINDSIGFISGNDSDFTLPNYIFKTVNGGYSWDSIQTESDVEFTKSIFFINPNVGWIILEFRALGDESLDKTINGGINWYYQINTPSPMNSVFFIDSLNGWLSGKSGFSVPTIFRTTNGGSNWQTTFPATGAIINSLHFINRNKGWAVGENKVIQATTNGGINWINQTLDQPGINYRSVYFTDSLTGWVVGDSGVILKTTNGGTTGLANNTSEIPDKFSLSQNYPNPFNPNTIINYQCSRFGFISLKVSDVLGNEIVTLLNEQKNAGSYTVEFESSNLPSGIYFYSLIVNGVTIDTKRMVILK